MFVNYGCEMNLRNDPHTGRIISAIVSYVHLNFSFSSFFFFHDSSRSSKTPKYLHLWVCGWRLQVGISSWQKRIQTNPDVVQERLFPKKRTWDRSNIICGKLEESLLLLHQFSRGKQWNFCLKANTLSGPMMHDTTLRSDVPWRTDQMEINLTTKLSNILNSDSISYLYSK